MWLYGWDSLMVSHTPATFGGRRHRDNGVKTFLFQVHVTKISHPPAWLFSFQTALLDVHPSQIHSHRSHWNGYLGEYSYMNTLEKAELTTLVYYIERFRKSVILIYNSELSNRADRKSRIRRKRRGRKITQAITKRCVFHSNAISSTLNTISLLVVYSLLFSNFVWVSINSFLKAVCIHHWK